MKIFTEPTVPESRIPLLQDPLAAQQVPACVLEQLTERLAQRRWLEQQADGVLDQLRPRLEVLAQTAVRQALRDAWLQRHPETG